ncbi:MAG: hypothetical protein B7Y23_03150 [Sulfurovum sp. 16-42-52]|nr:MAG: hypothetical protein B7Y23_03150 [Sulfurovum sp. 16-42-52]OZA46051.1 MAG: hypothetical protein B7X80_03735 [Sulfurovum sp. 17-42-90]
MLLIFKPTFSSELKQILEYIAQDKPSASMKFKNDLKESLNLLLNNPTMHRESIYFQDKNMRDMVHRGYTVVYRIRPIKKEIEILRIFNKNKPTQ